MSNDDDEAMRKAFHDFMLAGGGTAKSGSGKKKKKKKSNPNTSQDDSPRVKEEKSRNDEEEAQLLRNHQLQSAKKAQRRYWQLFHTFCGTVRREWMDVDDNLEEVVNSIANLRGRIPQETRLLSKLKNDDQREWSGYGHRESSVFLTEQDVELALSHDLLQHEKMMAGTRTLLAALSEAQDRLGRQLDEMMMHHADVESVMDGMEGPHDPASSLAEAALVEDLSDIFSMLAMELYRKQRLAESLLQSVKNDVLGVGDGSRIDLENGYELNEGVQSSKRIAEICCKEWPRGSRQSCIDGKRLKDVLSKSDTGNTG